MKMGMFNRLRRKRKEPNFSTERKSATHVDDAIARLSDASDKDKVVTAMELLKSSDSEIRAAVASEVARLEIKAVGVWYELANALGDEYESVRIASAKAFWQLGGVEYAIRSLRDEYEAPAHMDKKAALKGISALKKTAGNSLAFEETIKSNWEKCPTHEI
jgi:hypothetical protein